MEKRREIFFYLTIHRDHETPTESIEKISSSFNLTCKTFNIEKH
jgi:ABC-type cobalamin transport system ATPase subunit